MIFNNAKKSKIYEDSHNRKGAKGRPFLKKKTGDGEQIQAIPKTSG